MKELLHSGVTRRILAAAFTVHKALGPGFLEAVYEQALAVELDFHGIAFQRQVSVPVHYRSRVVGTHRLDLVVESVVIVELKTVTELIDIHMAIVRSYLTAADLKVALLLNFAQPSLQVKRLVRDVNSWSP